jgi:hypothetical protein
MSTLLEPQINLENEAAASRFFIRENTAPSEPERYLHRQAFTEARDFWLRHSDLLHQPVSIVMQHGIDEHGEFVALDKAWKQALTLSFDVSRASSGIFGWQLTIAEAYGTREVYQHLIRSTDLRAVCLPYDRQGRKLEPQPQDPETLGYMISDLLDSPVLAASVCDLRERRRSGEVQLSRICVEELGTVSTEKYLHTVQRLQQRVDGIGFSAGAFDRSTSS